MYGQIVYSSEEQHYMMRANYRQGGVYKNWQLGPNYIYDFNAERWQFLDEYRLKDETNKQIESRIGAFMNW